jgi:alpha-mannosidase
MRTLKVNGETVRMASVFSELTNQPRVAFLSTLAACCFLTVPALGQFSQNIPPDLKKTLSPAAQTTIEQLGELDTLPGGEWRMHAGDVAHGETVGLDDSSWQTVQADTESPADAVWYRREIEVPKTLHGYDLTGTRIWFRFRAWANGPMPQIIYFNGRRVALGDDLEPIVLFDNAKPGEKVLVAVKLLHTAENKHFAGADMRIDFAENRPNPDDLRQEFLSSAALIPSLSKNPAADTATLEKAISEVDLKSLEAKSDKKDQERFDASLKQSTDTLSSLKPMLQTGNFHLSGNSHIDAAWLWPWTETVDAVRRTFGTAVQLMNEYPTYTYTQSAAQYNEWIADKYPDINNQIKERIKEGRWEIVGGMWVEPDLNMPDGESLVRQLLIGKRTYKQLYGVDVKIGWNPDSFGYTWQLPQIYKKSGVDYFVTQKMQWNDTNQLPLKLFWWESPDGSKVLSYFPHDYANTALNPVRLSADLATARKYSPGITSIMDLYGVGDHGGGPTRSMLDEGLHWMQPDKVVPKSEFGVTMPYFEKIKSEVSSDSPTWNYQTLAASGAKLDQPAAGQITIPTWKDELYLEYHRGVFTTQALHKRSMRDSEEWVLDAEKYSSLAWLDGETYPQTELNDAWKKVLFNQFHDLGAGSGIGVIYKDAQKDYQDVRWATNEASSKALDTLQGQIDTKSAGENPVLIFNPLAWERSGLVPVDVELPSRVTSGVSVVDAHDHVLPSEAISTDKKTNTYHLLVAAKNIPSLGYEVVHIVPGKRPFTSDLKAEGTTLENASLRVKVDPATGCITSLYDKKASFETLASGACGNELQAFKDLPKDYDAWNIDPGTYDAAPTLLNKADSVQLLDKDPAGGRMRATIRITRTWQHSKFVQDVSLYSGSDQVEVSNDIDWHEDHILLKAAFALAASSKMATYEIPYGTIERATTRDNSFEKAMFEVPAMRWADLGDGRHGFSLINNSKYGYDAKDNVLRLTLLRSPTWPDPVADRGHQHFTYALYPHAGDWKQAMSVRHGYEYNYGLKALQVMAHPGNGPLEQSFASIKGDNVVLTAVKKAEDGNSLIVRFYEWAGKANNVMLTVPKGATDATIADMQENVVGSALSTTHTEAGDVITVPVTPYEIQTVRINYAPAAKTQEASK